MSQLRFLVISMARRDAKSRDVNLRRKSAVELSKFTKQIHCALVPRIRQQPPERRRYLEKLTVLRRNEVRLESLCVRSEQNRTALQQRIGCLCVAKCSKRAYR